MLQGVIHWVQANPNFIWGMVWVSILTLIGSIVVAPLFILQMPADYFTSKAPPKPRWSKRHPALRLLLHVMKNLLGGILALAGLLMSLPAVPGQGILTLLIGLSLLDLPRKRAFELKIVRLKGVHQAIDWIRARGNRPPLELPPSGSIPE